MKRRGMARRRSARRFCCAGLLGLAAVAPGGCTRESVRVALAAQQRADQVQQAVFERQAETLRILLYRDLVARLEDGGRPLTEAQRAALNAAWNERDLFEFWALQQERARALRLVGVEAKLASDQSIVDLLIKALKAQSGRVEAAAAAAAGSRSTSR